ncbi:carbohydrate ABC transporter permease [Microbacterium luteolum]|uniref:Carbohydrate ABC transporter permease n=1 Tax=Microbacterium luteolum TaxID=69367 RepID=A0ABY7XR23_MICLT|nr:carbohydrate ABC transporter permease [Microbacterium luteolum]WDM44502.1 carbohydrate ABC transporter permease [Microbacterium luteolum]
MTTLQTQTQLTVATPTVQRPRPGQGRRAAMRAIRRIPVWILVALLMVVVLYPQVWMVLGSFKTQSEFLSDPALSLPKTWQFDNYISALTNGDVARNYLNSIIVTIPSVLLIVFIGVAAGYALEVMIWRGRNAVLLYVLAGIMVPGQMILVPLFIVYFRLGLTNTMLPMIITYTVMGLPLTTFLMATYFRAVPREIFEAATVDGSGPLRSFFLIGMPMMKNAILTVGIVQFFSVWNDLLIALTFTTRPELATIQVGLLSLSDEYGSTQYGPLFAAVSLNILVLMIVFLALNKKIMAGMAGGALKG